MSDTIDPGQYADAIATATSLAKTSARLTHERDEARAEVAYWRAMCDENLARATAAEREAQYARADMPCACGPWHPDMDGPQEDCPGHGRTYADWIERGDVLQARAEAAEATIARVVDLLDRTDGHGHRHVPVAAVQAVIDGSGR